MRGGHRQRGTEGAGEQETGDHGAEKQERDETGGGQGVADVRTRMRSLAAMRDGSSGEAVGTWSPHRPGGAEAGGVSGWGGCEDRVGEVRSDAVCMRPCREAE